MGNAILNVNPWQVLDEDADLRTLGQKLKQYQAQLEAKWKWYLDGDEKTERKAIPRRLRPAMAQLFENQWAYSKGLLTEDTLSTDITLPVKFALPLIRAMYPRLFASRICAIQPMPLMSGGTAQAFFLDYIREHNDSKFTTLESDWSVGAEKSIPKLGKLTLRAESVKAEKDILAACWPTEVMEDLKGAMGIDIDPEMIGALGDEIGREIDARLLAEIIAGASAGNVTWYWGLPVDWPSTPQAWYETLAHALTDADTLIYRKRFRGANYVVLGTNAYGYFAKMATFVPRVNNDNPADSADQPGQYLGAELVGTFNGYWDVYRTVFIDEDAGIIGRYPTSWIDAGYIFMPYIPLTSMPLVYGEMDADTGNYQNKDAWTRNVRTRNGKYFAVKDLFATLSIAEAE